jgi:hypothetical protein
MLRGQGAANHEECDHLDCLALALGVGDTASAATQPAAKAGAIAQDCGAGRYRWKGACHRFKHRYLNCNYLTGHNGLGIAVLGPQALFEKLQ